MDEQTTTPEENEDLLGPEKRQTVSDAVQALADLSAAERSARTKFYAAHKAAGHPAGDNDLRDGFARLDEALTLLGRGLAHAAGA